MQSISRIFMQRLVPHDGVSCEIEVSSERGRVLIEVSGLVDLRLVPDAAEELCDALDQSLGAPTRDRWQVRASGAIIDLTSYRRYVEFLMINTAAWPPDYSKGMLYKTHIRQFVRMVRSEIRGIQSKRSHA